MATHLMTALGLTSLLAIGTVCLPAKADNPMGYRLLTTQEATGLPHNHGALGLDVERSQQITDSGMTFDIIRIKQVKTRSPGAQAGLRAGDQIIALDGRVFPTLTAFAAYVGAMSPGDQTAADIIPAGGGPAQAKRVAVTAGGAAQPGQSTSGRDGQTASAGMSTGEKVAIGAGAVALLGCYEMGCFSHRGTAQPPAHQQPRVQ